MLGQVDDWLAASSFAQTGFVIMTQIFMTERVNAS